MQPDPQPRQHALSAAGGLTNPQVEGLLAYQPLAVQISKGQSVSAATIDSKVGVHSSDLANLLFAEQKVLPAKNASPGEWKRWWGVCIGVQAVFLGLVFLMRGRWSPRRAKQDFEAHERLVTEELAKISAGEPVATSAV